MERGSSTSSRPSRSCSTGGRPCSPTRSSRRARASSRPWRSCFALVREGESLEFLELFARATTKGEMIVTFPRLLELIRLRRVKVYQRGAFGAIRVFRPWGRRRPARRRNGARPARGASGEMGDNDWTEGTDRTGATDRRRTRSPPDARKPPGPSRRPRRFRRCPPRGPGGARGPGLRLARAGHPAGGLRPGPPGRPASRLARRPRRAEGGVRPRGPGLQLVEVAAGTRSRPAPSTTSGSRSCSTRGRRPASRSRPSRRWPVIAYKQPVTLPEIIELRGVKWGRDQDAPREAARQRSLGRKEVVGRPMLYARRRSSCSTSASRTSPQLPRIEEFAEVLGEEVDVVGLRKAIETPASGRGAPRGGGAKPRRPAPCPRRPAPCPDARPDGEPVEPEGRAGRRSHADDDDSSSIT